MPDTTTTTKTSTQTIEIPIAITQPTTTTATKSTTKESTTSLPLPATTKATSRSVKIPPDMEYVDDEDDKSLMIGVAVFVVIALVALIVLCAAVIVAVLYTRTKNRKELSGPHHARKKGKSSEEADMKRKITLSKQPKKLKVSTASKEPDKPAEPSTPNQVRVQPLKPKKVKGEKIDMREFNARGPLEMKAEFKGAVKHDLDREDSASLENLQFDKNLNSMVLIGTQIEKLTSQSQEATTQSKIKGAPGQRPEEPAAESAEAPGTKKKEPQEGQEKPPPGSKESKGESGAAAGSSDQPRQEGGKLVEKSSIDDRKK
nr:unnamed protein product [Haemonchus contortus]